LGCFRVIEIIETYGLNRVFFKIWIDFVNMVQIPIALRIEAKVTMWVIPFGMTNEFKELAIFQIIQPFVNGAKTINGTVKVLF
tara:strand:+ start:154 stop:402 length:249 start_codon:yes stop_codon:yes gene_type:complete